MWKPPGSYGSVEVTWRRRRWATQLMSQNPPVATRDVKEAKIVEHGGLDDLVRELRRRTERRSSPPPEVWLASPFLGAGVAELLAAVVVGRQDAGKLGTPRVLTTLTGEAFRSGYSSPAAMTALMEVYDVRALSNLHAKVFIIDDWAMIGTGNLSAAGLDGLNVELGMIVRGKVAAQARNAFDAWWAKASAVTRHDLALARSEAARGRRQHKLSSLGRFHGSAFPVPAGTELRGWLADTAAVGLTDGLLADGEQPRQDLSRTLPHPRSEAYMQTRRLRFASPGASHAAAQVLLRAVAVHHPRADARAHALYRLTHDAYVRDHATLAVLWKAHERDPALNVRLNARRHIGVLVRRGDATWVAARPSVPAQPRTRARALPLKLTA